MRVAASCISALTERRGSSPRALIRASKASADEETRFTEGTLPNGLAFDADGFDPDLEFRDGPSGAHGPGTGRRAWSSIRSTARRSVKVNFVLRDSRGRIWLTISTRIRNWMRAISPNIADGYVAVLDENGARIVADGFHFTNEIRFDANEEWLYVVETTARRITRLRIGEGAQVEEREIFGPDDTGGLHRRYRLRRLWAISGARM